ncbi:MAG: Ig-like domain-containing protein [bacterium]
MNNRLFSSVIVLLFILLPLSAHAVTITSSALDHLVILPNDRPTLVDIATDQQFTATGYTQENEPLAGITFAWTTEGDIGTISSSGIFTGNKGGTGKITATSGDITASVGVVVRGVAAKETNTTPSPTNVPSSTTTVQPVNTNTAANVNANANIATNSNTNTAASATTATHPCTTIRAWVWVLLLFLYCIVLFAYYLSLGESRTPWWWVWPAIVTAAPFALYFALRCGTTHAWVPWILGILTLAISVFYLRVLRPSGAPPSSSHP